MRRLFRPRIPRNRQASIHFGRGLFKVQAPEVWSFAVQPVFSKDGTTCIDQDLTPSSAGAKFLLSNNASCIRSKQKRGLPELKTHGTVAKKFV